MSQRRRQTARTPTHEDEGAWDWEDDGYPEFGEVHIPDFSLDLSKEDERAFALFRKVLEGAFSETGDQEVGHSMPRKRKQKETKSLKDTKPARKRAIPKSPPARHVPKSR